MVRFELCGRFTIVGPSGVRVGVRGEQPAVTLARLVLDRPRPLTRHELSELLWPEGSPEQWEGPARKVVTRARQALTRAGVDSAALRSEEGRITLVTDLAIGTDVEDALAGVGAAAAALDDGDLTGAATLAESAAATLRMPFFPNAESAWVAHWRPRLRAALSRALHIAAEAALADGRADDAVAIAEEAIALEPFDEIATRALMAAHEARGSRAQALAAYERCRRLLDDELGVRPSAETERAHLALLGPATDEPVVPAPSGAPSAGPVVPLPFVGRRAELSLLVGRVEALGADGGSMVVVRGEPGIGKTRLAHELAARVAGDGALVLWGECVPGVGLPFQPFTAVVSQLVTQRPQVLDRLGNLVDDLAPVVPGIERTSRPMRRDEDQVRARVFRAVEVAFEAIAQEQALVVLDDLQWADADALALARHLAPTIASRPWLWCVTLRHAEGPVAALLADLARRLPVVDLPLEGLAEPDLAEMLERAGVGEAGEAARLAPDVARRTAGNPFFVGQLVNDAIARRSSLDLTGVPGAVAQHVVRRVESLDRPRAALLVLAAIIGGDVDAALLEACATEPERVVDRLEDLTRERFLEERDADRFGFPHAIVRDAVLATVSPTRARRLHGRVGDALAARGAEPAVVAHHYVAAGPARAADATTFLLAAGEEALTRGEWSVAGEQFATAVRTAPTVGDRNAARVGLGRAQRALGETPASRATLEEALAEARAHGDGRGAARAILALVGGGGRGVAVDMPDAERTELWREALAALPDDDDPLAVPVLGGLALSLVLTEAVEERVALCDRAVAAARAGGDPETVASALLTRRVALMGPAGTEARLRDGEEVLSLDRTAISMESRLGALLGRVEDELEMGRRDEVDAALVGATIEAARIAHPYWSWATTSWRALLAIVDGHLEEAEVLAHEAFNHQAPAQHPEALAALGVNLVVIRFFQDRAEEVVDLLATAAEESPNIPGYRAVLALAHTVAGDQDAADAAYRGFVARDFALPGDSNWLIGMAGLSEAAVTLRDADGARVLLERLAPYEDRHLLVNVYGGGGAYWGPIAYQLARLGRLTGDLEGARRWAGLARDRAAALRAECFRSRCEGLAAELGLPPPEGAQT